MITFYLRKKEMVPVVAAEDNSSFVIIKNTSPVAAVIDPRVVVGEEVVEDVVDKRY